MKHSKHRISSTEARHHGFYPGRYMLMCLALAACNGPSGSNSAQPVQASQSTETIKPIETIAPLPTPIETFKALAPEQGLKLTPLFATPIADNDARVKRVEDAVQGMRNDFDSVMPAMVRMVAMEKNLQDLVGKLQTLSNQPPLSDPVPYPTDVDMVQQEPVYDPAEYALWESMDAIPDPAEAPAATPTVAAKPAATKDVEKKGAETFIGDVKAVRIGDHGETTRIVLDMTAKANFATSFQNDGRQLVIDLPQMNWTARSAETLKAGGRISAYKFENGKVVFDLPHPVQIKTKQTLPPESGAGLRLVIDLADSTPAAK